MKCFVLLNLNFDGNFTRPEKSLEPNLLILNFSYLEKIVTLFIFLIRVAVFYNESIYLDTSRPKEVVSVNLSVIDPIRIFLFDQEDLLFKSYLYIDKPELVVAVDILNVDLERR